MALHGEIKINNQIIGEWSAIRKEEVKPGTYKYDCSIKYVSLEGHRFSGRFLVTHKFDDGAVVLASKLLLRSRAEMTWARA